MKRSGRKSLSQTKAPLNEQIKGSKTNPKGSASSKSKASKITLSEKIMDILKKKKDKYNKSHSKDVDTNSLKAVMRRGMGAYSTSHRPGITRQGWGFARVNKFLLKKGGTKVKAAYVQDDDLLEKGGKVANITFMKWVIEYNVNNKDEILAFFSLPSKYINPSLVSENNNNVILDVFEKQKDNIDAKKHFQKMLDKVDELGVTIYLEPIPRVHKLKSEKHKQKITKDYLIKYYNNFGFTKDKNGFMVRHPKMAKGGELNPDDPKLKNTMIHKSGSAGGVLVGKRHSEGGIKAINKSSDSPLEMEGGEVVITRNAVSDNEKREFEGKMMTNREILSKINEEGGGVAFADGGKLKKESDYCCDDTMEDGGDTNSKIYKGFEIGSDGTYKIPNVKNFGIKHHDLPPSEAFKKLYSHTFKDGGEIYKDGGLIQIIDKQVPSITAFKNAFKHVNFHSVKNAYKQHLKKMYNVTFIELPHRIQMALLLGNQKLVDKFINE